MQRECIKVRRFLLQVQKWSFISSVNTLTARNAAALAVMVYLRASVI